MYLPNFQYERLKNTYQKNSFILIYDTGYLNEVEILDTQVNGIYYPITFKTYLEAKNYLDNYVAERYNNLRPHLADELLNFAPKKQ